MAEIIQTIAITDILPPKFLLRDVRKGSVDYLELRDSIEADGLINSILVRPVGDRFEVVDGFWRYNCLLDLNRTTAPCIVKELSDRDVLTLQLKANSIRPETTRLSFARHLQRLIESYPDITLTDLSYYVGKRPQWVRDQLQLLNIRPEYQTMVDRGEISISNAYHFCKLPPALQDKYLDSAKLCSHQEFEELIRIAVRDIMVSAKDRNLSHNYFKRAEVQPIPHLRSLKTVLNEYTEPKVGPELLMREHATTPIQAWRAALKWVLNLDEQSVANRRQNVTQRKSLKALQRSKEERDMT